MSETPNDPERGGEGRVRTEARPVRSRWPGLVWAIPLAVLIIVAYLGLNAYAQRGVDVVVTFGTSGGAKVGETLVVYKGVTIGRVVKIEVAKDIGKVDMTLRLEPRVKPALREGAKFWLIGAQANLLDISALKAVVSGVSIGASPGTGAPTRRFIGLDAPPPVPPDTPGRAFGLRSSTIGSLPVGAGVYFHGVLVGHVKTAEVRGPHDFDFTIFVIAPYDRLVHDSTAFYLTHPIQLDVTDSGVAAQLGPGDSPLKGGVEFEDLAGAGPSTEAAPGAAFDLYDTKAEAADPPQGPQIAYQAVFPAASAIPPPDAPVFLGGVRIGRVLSSKLGLTVGAHAPLTRVRLEVEPQKLNLSGAATPLDGRQATDAAMAGLVAGGYRLKLAAHPPLVGLPALVFAQAPGARRGAVVQTADGAPELPTAETADLSAITDRTVSILDKVDRIPLTEIGTDVRAITGRVRTLVSSPQVSDSLNHLDSTLRQVDAMVSEVKPQVGPLITKLNAAAGELQGVAGSANALLGAQGAPQDANLPDAIRQLTEAARSIRSLADYLGRHPEAVIRGKAKEP